jgi:hypothetical protein
MRLRGKRALARIHEYRALSSTGDMAATAEHATPREFSG